MMVGRMLDESLNRHVINFNMLALLQATVLYNLIVYHKISYRGTYWYHYFIVIVTTEYAH